MNDSRRLDLLAVGDADLDIYIRVPRAAGPGQKVLGDLLGVRAGGMAANVACAAARLGLHAGLVAPLGTDSSAQAALSYYEEVGLDVRHVHQVTGAATYLSVVILDEHGEKALIVARTDAFFPGQDHLASINFAEARAVHVVPFAEDGSRRVVEAAAAAGCIVSLDIEASMVPTITDLGSLVAPADLVFVNEFAASTIGGSPDEGLRRLHELGAALVVMTSGASGASVSQATGRTEIATFATAVVDTTGAGDCFAAGFLTAYLDGADVRSCAGFASATAACAIGSLGGSHGVPRRAEVSRMLLDEDSMTPEGPR